MIGHPIDCHCSDCLGPIVLDMRRITAGLLGLCLVLIILWLVWIATPA
jgi:hypothetical protein